MVETHVANAKFSVCRAPVSGVVAVLTRPDNHVSATLGGLSSDALRHNVVQIVRPLANQARTLLRRFVGSCWPASVGPRMIITAPKPAYFLLPAYFLMPTYFLM